MPFLCLIDKFTLIFLITVSIIRVAVFTFGSSYMHSDTYFSRFHLLLLVFVASILVLILRPGLLSLFLGWDGLGLSSFLLVIYYSNSKSLNAALITVIRNRLGDAFLLVAIAVAPMGHSFSLPALGFIEANLLRVFVFMLVIGAFTKRAQLPFCAWLPAAIAAPTPVSSLVHSSTLVTAGVYVLFRSLPFIPAEFLNYVAWSGGLTILVAGLAALSERDMKKIVALSTLSQLGIIVIALGLNRPILRFFHLIAHAFFKALLFIGVGNLIHAAARYQDLKVMRRFIETIPFSRAILICAKASLCGLPFFSGFFSKEIVLENLDLASANSICYFFLIVLGIMLTQIYTFRFINKVLLTLGKFRALHCSFDTDKPTNTGIIILFIPAFTGGIIFSSLIRRTLPNVFTPPISKQLVVLSVVLSLFIIRILQKQNVLKSLSGDKLFNLWLMPIFRGQAGLKAVKLYSDYLHKRLSLTLVDLLMGKWLSQTFFSAQILGAFLSPYFFRNIISLITILVLFSLYLCIHSSLKIQNFTWLHPYILNQH